MVKLRIRREAETKILGCRCDGSLVLLYAACSVGALWAISGCATPGKPLPPSLGIPRVVSDLTASRTDDTVHLRWTTPGRTTDGVEIRGKITAEICRDPASASAGGPAAGQVAGVPQPCTVVIRLQVSPGASASVDRLSAALASASPALLAYRIQLRGETNKTAGGGPAAYVASGAAPERVHGLKGTTTEAGAVLEWTRQPSSSGDSVELQRTELVPPGVPKPSRGTARSNRGFDTPLGTAANGPKPEAAATRFRGGPGDAGGVVDRTAVVGSTYLYAAERVRTVTIAGRTLELRSAPSEPVTIILRNVYPPHAPVGLVAAPGPGSIDLSWESGNKPSPRAESDPETQLAGYRVYRRGAEGGEWERLNDSPVAAPAYRDLSAQAGHRYRYRVTGVDTAGRESTPSEEAVEELSP